MSDCIPWPNRAIHYDFPRTSTSIALPLPSHFHFHRTSTSIKQSTLVCLMHMRNCADRELALFLKKCDERKVPTIMTDIEEKIGWIRLWSLSMDQGHKGVSGLKAFVRIVCHPPHALKLCPKCDATDLGDESLLSHVITQHLTVNRTSSVYQKRQFYHSLQESLLFTDCSSFVLSLSLLFIVLLLLVTIPAGSPLLFWILDSGKSWLLELVLVLLAWVCCGRSLPVLQLHFYQERKLYDCFLWKAFNTKLFSAF